VSARCRIVFDRPRCATIGLCELAVPDFFRIADDGALTVLVESAEASRRSELEEAAQNCPTQSIRIVDA
jgi:ferredoxin